VTTLDGQPRRHADYRGKTLLIVNVASACGYTPQYTGLEALYRKYQRPRLRGARVPCNQFGGQEPGSAEEIATFCSTKYDVTFPLFAKVDVNGAKAPSTVRAPQGRGAGRARAPRRIKWNFTKFSVNSRGEVVERYGSSTTPAQVTPTSRERWTAPPPVRRTTVCRRIRISPSERRSRWSIRCRDADRSSQDLASNTRAAEFRPA
jgi:glutathione peroxidase